ncbi:MAG TPA: dihydrodipicolinate synthase family protein [Candidatus Acidoferrales bacterium]|nr:dihydrodipicolinate synthase family protein [Candidatus Acidoferrales bacterium]
MTLDLQGVFSPLTTPFETGGPVSIADLTRNVGLYNRTALAGYVVLGSTGEAVMLSRAEADSVLAAVKATAGAGKILLAGTGAESTAETIQRTQRAADLGYPAALVKTPHYYKPQYKSEALIAHFRRVADAAPIPILLYSVPQFTGISLEAAEVAALAEHPNIIGIKDSSGSVQRLSEMLAAAPPSFQTLSGSASTLYSSLAAGARGAILALACVLPELCVELYAAYRAGHQERAQKLQELLLPASKAIVAGPGPAGVKCGMDLRGYAGGAPRSPLLPVSEGVRQEIQKVLAALPAREVACA